MKIFSMFSGIGGAEYGIKRAIHNRPNLRDGIEGLSEHIPNTEARAVRFIGYSEIDKYAIQVYERNYPDAQNYGDAKLIKPEELPDFDILVGGFPCQAFSVAGRRRGFEDTRGTLFFEIARIAAYKKPKYLVLENVKGLLSHDGGRTFQTILKVLSDTGYDVSWSVHNSKNYGVPQNRERIYIIANLRGEPRPEVLPLGEPDEENPTIRTVRAGGAASYTEKHARDIIQINNPTHSNDRVYSDEGISPTLNTMQGGRRQPKIVQPVITPDRLEKRQNGRRMKENGEPAFTVNTQDRHGVYDGTKIRRLTPTECLRLQGFPDNWCDGQSDSQKYKQAGNAMTTNVVQHVFEEMRSVL